MKKTFFSVGALLSSCLCIVTAQKNNPFNQNGLDYFKSLEIISEDFKAGKVKDFNEESLAYYSDIIPLKVTASVDLATAVYKKIKGRTKSFSDEIDNMSLQPVCKSALRGIVTNYNQVNTSDYKSYIINECNTIATSKISEPEKQLVLTLLAIAYHGRTDATSDVTIKSNFRTNDADCTISDGSGNGGGIPCWLAGAILGAGAGATICSWPCGIAGAIIGGIVGSLC